MKLEIAERARPRARRRRDSARAAAGKALLFGGGAAIAGLVAFFDKRRRHIARDRALATARQGVRTATRKADHMAGVARGAVHKVTPSGEREYDDVTLARKVETEIFRPPDAPKDRVDVNVHDGIVELRGTVDAEEQAAELAAAARRVGGVNDVHNLLQVAGAYGAR